MQQIKTSHKYFRLLFNFNVQKYIQGIVPNSSFTTAIDAVDLFTHEPFQRNRSKERNHFINANNLRHFMETDTDRTVDIEKMTTEEISNLLLDLLAKNKETQITNIVTNCINKSKFINEVVLKKLFRSYSLNGKVYIVELLQKYCLKLNPYLYKRNGEFLHYLAKAQCMKGNSEKGLLILKQAYTKYQGLRNFYRIILRELIQDSVQNRSEASMVVFKRYVLLYSDVWNDHYPLICFWHVCWSSSWFSDQKLADELFENSKELRNIIRDKATIFCICILRDYNEDAVVRLLQGLLRFDMIVEYAKVLQILFTFKLKKRDIRGCTEIIKNCEALGIALPSYQQGRYIKMLISNKHVDDRPDDKPKTPESKNFKLKF